MPYDDRFPTITGGGNKATNRGKGFSGTVGSNTDTGTSSPWHSDGARVNALVQSSNIAAGLLAPTEYDSASLQIEDVGSAALTGIGQGGSIGFALTGTAFGPVGWVAAGVFAGLSLLDASKKREAAEKQWKNTLNQYKRRIRGEAANIKSASTEFEKRAKQGSLQSIYDATFKAASNIYNQIDVNAAGVKNLTQEKKVSVLDTKAEGIVENTYNKLLKKVDILNRANEFLTLEKEAGREFGQITTKWYDEYLDTMEELENV